MSLPSEEIVASFNKLVYEYLVKMKLDKAAVAFKEELDLGDVRINEAVPTLLNWYNIFLETAEVRAGILPVPESLNRIEGIMLKLENDKARYSRLTFGKQHEKRASPQYGQAPYSDRREMSDGTDAGMRPSSRGYGKSYERAAPYERISPYERSTPYTSDVPPPTEYTPPHYMPLREYNLINMNIPYITLAHYCPSSQIVIACCVDGKAYFYNVATQKVEYSFALPKHHVKALKVIETNGNIFFMVSFDETVIHLFRYTNGIKEDMKVIQPEGSIRAFCFGERAIFILTSIAVVSAFSFVGDPLRSFKVSSSIHDIAFFGINLLLIDPNSVTEYDVSINMEIKTLARGKNPRVIIKGDLMFLIFVDSVQVFNYKSPFPVITFKNLLNLLDIDLVANRVAICTGNETYIGNEVFPVSNSILISSTPSQDAIGCFVLSANATITCISSCIN